MSYARRVGLFSGTMAVVGGIIGSGIFLNPAIVAQRVGSSQLTLLAWVLGGVVAVLGGFIFGELGRRLPRAGGTYVYLREAISPLAGFLYAWALLLIMSTGAAAAVGYTFASYAVALFGIDASLTATVAAAAIGAFTVINLFGVQFGAWTQNVFVILKLAAIALVIGAGFFLPAGGPAACVDCVAPTVPVGLGATVAAMATAFVPILFAYGGWQQTNFIAEEIIEPERNLPRALLIGVGIVVLVYLLANAAYLRGLGVDGLANSKTPAADLVGRAFGDGGRRLISIGIMISTAGFLNTVTMLSPRVYQAMARDRLFFETFSRLHPSWRTPVVAILFQGIWSIALLFSGSYGQLLDYVVFADWIFFGGAAVALLLIRRRAGPERESGFLVPGYPVTVWLFILAAGYVVVGSVASDPMNAVRGSGLLLLGVPVYWYWASRRPPAVT
ncbi:MAG: APC family permease [Gemmatimonadales bacterium]